MSLKLKYERFTNNPALPELIAEHHKHSSDGSDRAAHYHFLFPEVQLGARRLTSETSSQFKNNLIARSLEVEFGHEILTSRHNHKIIEHLDVSSQEVASLIREAGSQVIKPQASRGSRDTMERFSINGSKLAAQVQKLARAHTISSEQRDLILSAILHEHGLHLNGTRGRGLHSVMPLHTTKKGDSRLSDRSGRWRKSQHHSHDILTQQILHQTRLRKGLHMQDMDTLTQLLNNILKYQVTLQTQNQMLSEQLHQTNQLLQILVEGLDLA